MGLISPLPLCTPVSTATINGIIIYIFAVLLVGHRIWIDFVDYDLDESQTVKLYLSRTADYITPFRYRNSINDGAFLSEGESVNIEYSTNRLPRGRGFKIAYKMGTYRYRGTDIILIK